MISSPFTLNLFTALISNSIEITDCIAQWNGSLFNYTVHWRVPDFIAFGSKIFNSFLVVADLEQTRNKRDVIDSKFILKQPNQTSYSIVWTNFEPQHSQYFYEFDVIKFGI